jgi:phage portal protein BeeE
VRFWRHLFGHERREAGTIPAGGRDLGGYFHLPAADRVDVRRASGISVAYAAVSMIAQSLASVPLHVYRRTSGGGREKAIDRPLYGVLHDSPAEGLTAFELREQMIASIVIDGNALCTHRPERQWSDHRAASA